MNHHCVPCVCMALPSNAISFCSVTYCVSTDCSDPLEVQTVHNTVSLLHYPPDSFSESISRSPGSQASGLLYDT